jgi:hypothetical protein
MPRGAGLAQLDAADARGEDRRGAEDHSAFENERKKPLGITRAAIKQALEKAGIEFFEDDGLRLKR